MKTLRISDVTMKQTGEDFTLSFREKIELAKLLDRLGVSVIELEPIRSIRQDSLSVKSIASAVKTSTVAVPVELDSGSVERTWAALQQAVSPRLQVPAAVSSVQMEYLYRKKPDAMIRAISDTVKACRACCPQVEFIAGDATRSDPAFLARAITTALEAGATQITLTDQAGTMLPQEFIGFLEQVRTAVPGLDRVDLAVDCRNVLSMADGCSIGALCAGAVEVKAAAYPLTAASLENLARVLDARADTLGGTGQVRVTELNRLIAKIAGLCRPGQGGLLSGAVRQEEEGVYLTAHDDLEVVTQAAEQLGYELSQEDCQKVFEAFQSIASRKDRVSIRELDAIIASAAMQVPPTYELEVYAIQSGNTVSSTAHLKLRKGQESREGVSLGDGPIDAAFLAIEQITGRHYELDDFQIQAVTEGREAMGQTVVKLLSGGKRYAGRGISTDIVGASIQAYLSALNKIVYEEEAV